MPLLDTLDALTANSKDSASIQFKSTSPSIFADVKSRKRVFLREPAPHELLLQDLCAGTSTFEELRQSSDEDSNIKSAKSREIHKLLQLKQKLDLPSVSFETKAKAEEVAHCIEEKLSSNESQRNGIKKIIAKEQGLARKLQLVSTDDGDADTDNIGGNEYTTNEESALEFNRRKNDLASKIELLPLELSERRKLIEGKISAIKEQQEIEQTLNQMVLLSRQREHHLQNQLSKLRQESEASALEHDSPSRTTSTTKRTTKPMDRPKIRQAAKDSLPVLQMIARLLHSDPQETASTNLQHVPQLSKSVHEELQPLLSIIESNASKTGRFSHVYYRALNAVQHSSDNPDQATPHADQFRALFPHGAPSLTSLFQTNQESTVMVSILLELDKQGGSMALADLTRFVQDLAKEQGRSEQEAIQCIYTLVGVGLVIIDRSQNDSIVKIPN